MLTKSLISFGFICAVYAVCYWVATDGDDPYDY